MSPPLPENITVCLTLKIGQPLTDIRRSVAQKEFIFQSGGTLETLIRLVSDNVEDHPTFSSNVGQIYAKPRTQTNQTNQVLLTSTHVLRDTNNKSWVKLGNTGRASYKFFIFIYADSDNSNGGNSRSVGGTRNPQRSTLQRATRSRIETARIQIEEHLEEFPDLREELGPLFLDYWERTLARQPEGRRQVNIPTGAVFNQLREVDRMRREYRNNQSMTFQGEHEFVNLVFRIQNQLLTFEVSLQSLRLALRMPTLAENVQTLTRNRNGSENESAEEISDVEDIDHASSDREAVE
jgi:hypothetical protein